MVKAIRLDLPKLDDPIFSERPIISVPIARPHQAAAPETFEQLLAELKDVGEIRCGTVEKSMMEQLERGDLPKRWK
jgi:hypothetical protein